VRLTLPPPLEKAMAVHAVDGGVELRDGDAVVASARPAELSVTPPAVVGYDTATAAAERTPMVAELHPFPTCFGCGPLREPGDALRHLCGPAGPELAACPAETSARLPHDADGHLLEEIVWAALDCPTASAVIPVGAPAHVLATFTVRIDAPVAVEEPHVVVAWPLGADGRKKRSAAALADASGRVCAVAEALWIELRR
jgi:hypothetical protein